MAIKFLADLDISGSEIQSVALENRTTDPSSASTGQIYFDTGTDEVKIYDGTNFIVVGKTYSAGNGISLSGTTFSVAGGDGLTQEASGLKVDATVIRTTGAQTKAGNMTFSNDVTVTGNLTVNGTQTILNTAELAVEDTNIELNSGASAGADSGISINRGQGADVPQLLWDESASRWTFTNDGSTFYNLPLSTEYNNFTYTLPTASASTLGGVKIGSRITISSGVISADLQTANDFTDALLTKLNGIASSADNYSSWTVSDGTNSETVGSGDTVAWRGSGATTVSYDTSTNEFSISSTNTQLTDAQVRSKISGTGLISYNSTTGVISTTANNYTLPTASASTLGGVKIGSGITITTGVISADSQTDNNFTNALKTKLDGIEASANNYALPTASASTLGGVKIGSGISISSGVISANSQTDNNFTDADHTKLDGIEAGADVTDTTNVVGALTAGTNITIAANGTISATDTNTTYSAGDGLSLSGTTFTNGLAHYSASITGDGTNYEITQDTMSVRVPCIFQIYDSNGNSVIADITMDSTNAKVVINSLPTGDYDVVAMGRRA